MADDALQGLAKTLQRLTILNEAQFDEQREQLRQAKKQTRATEKLAKTSGSNADKTIKELERKLADAEADKGKTLLDKVKQAFGFGGLGIDEAITKSGKRIKKGETGFEAALISYNKRIKAQGQASGIAFQKASEDLAKSNAAVSEGFRTAFSGLGDNFSELFGTTMGSQLKDIGKKLNAIVSLPLNLMKGLYNSGKMFGEVLKNVGLRFKKFGASLKNMFKGGIFGKLKLVLLFGAVYALYKVVSTFMKSGFFEGIMILKHAIMQGLNRLQIAYYDAMGKEGKADAERKNLVNNEIKEQKRLRANAVEANAVSANPVDPNSLVGLKADASFSETYANKAVMATIDNQKLLQELIAKATGVTTQGLVDMQTGASEASLDINSQLGKATSFVDMDTRTQNVTQLTDDWLGLQEQYTVKLGFEDEKGNTITAESLSETLGIDVAQVITYVQENEDLTMGDNGKIQKAQDYIVEKTEDGDLEFQGKAGFFNELGTFIGNQLGDDVDRTEDLPRMGKVSTKAALETKMALLPNDAARNEFDRDMSPNAVMENANFNKIKKNPDFRISVKEKYGFDPGFSSPNDKQQVGGIEIRELLLLNEDYARMINFMRVDLDEVVKRAAEKQGNNSNIQTQVTNNVGGSSYSGGGNPSTGGNPNHAIVGLGWAG